MTIIHTGTDIIEISRIRNALSVHGKRLLNRIFTEREQTYCLQKTDPVPSLAGRFAGKEAVAKALGTGIGGVVAWKDIEIFIIGQRPEVALPLRVYAEIGITKVILSISHCKQYAVATAIALA
ncbi:Holo-[acyl-carrier-protein] synthase,4'-phosphopantetheinyl transferase,3-oxoacyl-[acyl-carrier protein] reductase,holo-[acyl-carrier-protein] synthase,4'-phosphopantetheinyl transferase superfamily [Chlamydia serpentis]|uniref:Holo-[acyl-carrier-protein] synthase n=1 Tax=Chlamydia serpentis TaxID=1967782 RepID=A0A2R8FB41_9CHLA|nr:holo-ACP synthase [Chlamydia serpentis]SPN73457.1 Holo-[acyl-carrier-protein] synthase,4'-phosphopantetheinyl transferase,3-oxoacyl-[acyl-carrier protein] reductase,holo-[acyl-carrier-protein] synthase,4'-phosphopantetheinyl transferase superfamily [Chlamydia serpentis]